MSGSANANDGLLIGGAGMDTMLIADDRGVLLNLAQAKVEVVYGGYGNDVLTVNRKSSPNFKSCVTVGAVRFFAANNSFYWRDVA